jgi:hypothetical protein
LFEKLRRISATARLLDEQLYEQVHFELVNGQKRNGLWAKALANSDGLEEKAKALYIQYRFQSIKDEMEIARAIAEEAEKFSSTEAVSEHQKKIIEAEFERQRRIDNCEAILKSKGYKLKTSRAGWIVYEPLGGRKSIDTLEELEEYSKPRENQLSQTVTESQPRFVLVKNLLKRKGYVVIRTNPSGWEVWGARENSSQHRRFATIEEMECFANSSES